jgi:competence protein ComEC
VSHLDVEHAGGAAAVMQGLQPSRLLTAFDAGLLQAGAETLSGAGRLPCTTGQRFSLGDATVEVLHPTAVAKSRTAARDNAGSCVLRIASPAGSVLLAGDLPATSEAAIIRAARAAGNGEGRGSDGSRGKPTGKDKEGASALQADVLIVPQQGSRQAAGAALLAAVRPSFAVLQVGYRNRHSHPHPAVLERLLATGAVLLRTDHDGAVQIRLRAAGPAQVYRIRHDAPPYWRLDTAATGR